MHGYDLKCSSNGRSVRTYRGHRVHFTLLHLSRGNAADQFRCVELRSMVVARDNVTRVFNVVFVHDLKGVYNLFHSFCSNVFHRFSYQRKENVGKIAINCYASVVTHSIPTPLQLDVVWWQIFQTL